MSTVILFGAGASYGCGAVIPEAPPLGNFLYENLASCFPRTWGKLHGEIRERFRSNFERGMQIMLDKRSPDVNGLMRDMAVYFARFSCDNSTENLYVNLIQRLKDATKLADVIFSSLNYEMLLEYGASSNGLSFSYFGSSNVNNVSVWKLHGSINFIPRNVQVISESIDPGIHVDCPISYETAKDAILFCQTDTALYPAMCIYANAKPAQMCSSQIKGFQEQWRTKVMEVDRVLIIGAKPTTGDKHIWQPLEQTDAKVGFIGSGTKYKEWIQTDRDPSKTELLGERWKAAFEKCVEFLLRS